VVEEVPAGVAVAEARLLQLQLGDAVEEGLLVIFPLL
jgi:hypothetical protein